MTFNFYSSLPFWILLLAIVLVARTLDRKPRYRLVFLVVSSVLMILAIPGFTIWNLGMLIAASLFSYLIGSKLNQEFPSLNARWRRVAAAAGIVGIFGFLAFHKYQFLQGLVFKTTASDGAPAPRIAFMIGISYFSFKMMHFIVEGYKRKLEGASLINYFAYIVFFVPFISGPINRFSPFARQVRDVPATRLTSDCSAGGERIIRGLFKKFVLVQLVHPYVLANSSPAAGVSAGTVLLGLYAYAFYFYFDFSGYTDLAIGSARLFGLELPENFNHPFLKRNIRELWTNWHMSLTGWLVDYIYWPLVRKLRNFSYFRGHPILLSNLGMIITFIACGMWHGESANFLLWGAYHGLGISALTIYQRQKRKIIEPHIQRYFQSRLSGAVGTFLTFNYFAIGLALFVLDLNSLGTLLRSLF